MNNRTISLLIGGIILALASLLVPSHASATESDATLKDVISSNCEGVREIVASILELRYRGATLVESYNVCDTDAEDAYGLALETQCEAVVITAYSVDLVDASYRQMQSEYLANMLFEECVEGWVVGLSTE